MDVTGLVVLEGTNCSLHATVEGALSETVATVSLSTVPRLSLASGESDMQVRAGWYRRTLPTDLAVRSRSRRDQMTLPK